MSDISEIDRTIELNKFLVSVCLAERSPLMLFLTCVRHLRLVAIRKKVMASHEYN